uniref:CTP synthase n=1 Tax=Zeugodacus cucurbitae TaxID=28588 RepID=A0A0A1WWQ8_ZEUCU
MALHATNNMYFKDDNIETIDLTSDLQPLVESTESVLHNLSEITNSLQSQSLNCHPLKAEKARSSIAELQIKRRKEFQDKFNSLVKRSKHDKSVKTVGKERTLNEAKIPLVEIPKCALENFVSRECDTTDALLGLQNIKKEPEDELNPTNLLMEMESGLEDFASVVRNPTGISKPDNSNNIKSFIKEEPSDEFDLPNTSTLPSGDSLPETSYYSLLQQETFRTYVENCINAVNIEDSSEFELGPNGTRVLIKDLRQVNWTGVSTATRSLLNFLFDRQTLGTHTLSGKPSPALLYHDYTAKGQLDPFKINDLIYFMKRIFNCSDREIRNAITRKCAYTAKTLKK